MILYYLFDNIMLYTAHKKDGVTLKIFLFFLLIVYRRDNEEAITSIVIYVDSCFDSNGIFKDSLPLCLVMRINGTL